MRTKAVGVGVILAVGVLAAIGHARAAGQARSGETAPTVLEQAPTDRSIAIPKEKLDQHLKDMDAKKIQTLRMIEGGKFNVNIRRITNAETALIHPRTTDLWVVLEGSGTLTTGGIVEKGKFVGGESHPIRVGDVAYIPSALPHGVSGVNGSITWLNVRWDTDWPPDAELGAGTLPGRAVAAAGNGRGAQRGGGAEGGGRGAAVAPLEYGGSGEIFIPKERLDAYRKDMALKNLSLLRMIEGGHYNVNIRRQKTPSTEFHDTTIDTWVILQGGGAVNTGFGRTADGKRVEGTGAFSPAKVGDVFFIPAHVTHGFSAVDDEVYWLNIRWDVNYGSASPTK